MSNSLLTYCRQIMKRKNISGVLKKSSRAGKKLMLVLPTKTIHFGQEGSHTWAEGASTRTRAAYKARHGLLMLKTGQKAITVKYSPAYLSWNLLW